MATVDKASIACIFHHPDDVYDFFRNLEIISSSQICKTMEVPVEVAKIISEFTIGTTEQCEGKNGCDEKITVTGLDVEKEINNVFYHHIAWQKFLCLECFEVEPDDRCWECYVSGGVGEECRGRCYLDFHQDESEDYIDTRKNEQCECGHEMSPVTLVVNTQTEDDVKEENKLLKEEVSFCKEKYTSLAGTYNELVVDHYNLRELFETLLSENSELKNKLQNEQLKTRGRWNC
eukprot:510136_1